MGSGGVAVSAQAQAGPGEASASASCSGAANCSTSYTAHAEAHDRTAERPADIGVPGGYFEAYAWATCSGGGSSGGGCGAWATANAAQGIAASGCSGSYSSCDKDSDAYFVETAPALPVPVAPQPPAPGTADGQGDDPGGLVGERGGVAGFCLIICVVGAKDVGGELKAQVCLDSSCAVTTDSGARIGYGPARGFEAGRVNAQGTRDAVVSPTAAGIQWDAHGNSEYWRGPGEGYVHDGNTGVRVRYDQAAPGTGGSFNNPSTGRSFTATCPSDCTPTAPGLQDFTPLDVSTVVANAKQVEITFRGDTAFTVANGDRLLPMSRPLTEGKTTTRMVFGKNGVNEYFINGPGTIAFAGGERWAANTLVEAGTYVAGTTPGPDGLVGSLRCGGDCMVSAVGSPHS